MPQPMKPEDLSNESLVATLTALDLEVYRRWRESESREKQLRAEVERLKNFVSQIESICLYGDYDRQFFDDVNKVMDEFKRSEES